MIKSTGVYETYNMVFINQFAKTLVPITWILMTITSQTSGASFQHGSRVKKSQLIELCKNINNMRGNPILLYRIHCASKKARPFYRALRQQRIDQTEPFMAGKENPMTDVKTSSETFQLVDRIFDALRNHFIPKSKPTEFDLPAVRRNGHSEGQNHYSPVYLIKKWVDQNSLSK